MIIKLVHGIIKPTNSHRYIKMNTPQMNHSPTKQPVPLIVLNEATKRYGSKHTPVQALQAVSLSINQGEFVAIVGASGSGKSTLLQLMGGLDRPTSGKIMVNGKDLSRLSDRKLSKFRNQTIGFVFQFFYLQPFLNLARNIEVAAMPSRMKRRERKDRAIRLATQVGLSERLKHLPSELSGGQIQRAVIARALINNPSVILADEPTGNLDSKNSQEVIELFKRVQKENGTTIVVATHDLDIAAQADRVMTLKDGRIV